jgi:ribosomal protein L18E
VKILSQGEIEKKLVFQGVSFSKVALKKIEEAGGEVKKNQTTSNTVILKAKLFVKSILKL